MATTQTQRPQFFEGQFLGAEDLTAVTTYTRAQESSHILGAHTWGIAIGLFLKEAPQPGNQLQVFIEPGYAWDGFGRAIVVLAPFAIPTGLFKDLTYDPIVDEPNGRLIKIWLRYREVKTRQPQAGFGTCSDVDNNSRIQETFSVEIGDRLASEQHDQIAIAGNSVDASKAFQAFDPTDPLIPDESIPYQEFPLSGGREKWLIPLGQVRWRPDPITGNPGGFKPAASSERNAFRVTIGAVAGVVQAPEGTLRLKNRTAVPSAVSSEDLVWVEGKLRVEGDARLFGGKLDLRDPQGQDQGVPLSLRRAGDNQASGRQLRVQIGAAQLGQNSFQIGPEVANAFTPTFTVLDNGNVGLGTVTPAAKLEINGGGDLLFKPAAGEDAGDIIFQNAAAVQKGRIWSNPAAGAALFLSSADNAPDLAIDKDGKVGIGTTAPDFKLHVNGDRIHLQGGAKTLDMRTDGSAVDLQSTTDSLFIRSTGAAPDNNNIVMNSFPGDGSVAIGTSAPQCKLHVQNSLAGAAGNVSAHVAVIENASNSSDADVLALKVGGAPPSAGNNYITFFAGNTAVGRIEGNGSGGIAFLSGGSDFAECLPHADNGELFEEGDVVGIVAGRITHITAGAHHVSAITNRAVVIGNAPAVRDPSHFSPVAMMGQVPVKVRGPVRAGDTLAASGRNDGAAIAVSRGAAAGLLDVVGTAWESSSDEGVKRINTAIGLSSSVLRAQQLEIKRLREIVESLAAKE